MKVHLGAAVITGAVAAVGFYVGGALLNLVLPWGMPALASYIFHVDLIELSHPFTWDSLVIGAAFCAAGGGFIGGFVASVYNVLVSRLPAAASAGAPRAAPARQ